MSLLFNVDEDTSVVVMSETAERARFGFLSLYAITKAEMKTKARPEHELTTTIVKTVLPSANLVTISVEFKLVSLFLFTL